MAGATELPEVTQKWVANVTEYVAAMEEMLRATRDVAEEVIELQAEIDALHGKTINIGLDASAAQATAAAAAVNDLGNAEAKAARDSFDLFTMLDTLAQAERLQSETSRMLEGDSHGLATALVATTTAADGSGKAAGRAWQPWFLLGANWKTAVHWILAGSAEFLAVAIPAAIALGAGALVAAQGAQNAQEHFTALYGATEATANMFHKTVGDTLGLGHALQSAQNAANPGVYEILGSAVNDAKSGFSSLAGVGLQVVHMFDEFAARVTVDLRGGMGTQIQGLLSGMVRDLQQFGQILGNVGHALLNFASDMPGLVHVLLDVADAVSRAILWVSHLSPTFITALIAVEEFYRWGGLLVGMLVRLGIAFGGVEAAQAGNFITKFGAGINALVQDGGKFISFIGSLIGRLGAADGVLAATGGEVEAVGAEMTAAGAAASAWATAGISLVVAGLGFLIYKLATAKSGMQQFTDSLQQNIDKASNTQVLGTLVQSIAAVNDRLAQTPKYASAAAVSFRYTGQTANTEFGQGRGAIEGYNQQIRNTVQGATLLANTYHTSLIGAMEMADQAGVKLAKGITGQGQAAVIARMQIANLAQGYRAMGQPMGAVGQDMTALAIQSGLANTRVSQLNQAWDQFMQNLVGGTSGLSSFVTSLQNIGSGVAHVTQNLGQGAGFNQSIKQFASDLQNFGKNGAQAWQNFDQVVGSTAPQLIDWLRTAGAEGAIGGRQFQTAILAMASSLTPLASKSKTAQAEVLGLVQSAGLGIHTWPQLTAAIKNGHVSMGELAKIIQDTTQKMANMSQVAKDLGTVLSQQLASAVDAARLKASGLSTELDNLANDMAHGGARSATYKGDLNGVIQSMLNLHQTIPTITAVLNSMGIHITSAGVQALISAAHLHVMGNAAAAVRGQLQSAAQEARTLQLAIDALHGKQINVITHYSSIGGATAPGLGGMRITTGQHGGVIPGYQPGHDSVHAMLSPGEGILNPYAVRMLGAGWVHAVNAMAERGGGFNPAALRTGGGGGGGSGGGNVMLKVYLDGKEMFGNNKVQVLNYNTRNSGGRTGKWIPS